ncbi:hypothetical protein CgunFtcFv8_000804 [Champsocephalus gunnari]|uniref:Osteoglycin n=1 Tax=Champsocephalus gunnari TaxID=52237 RepID=A0AAN8DLC5_CHAGU|nr:hypothetical protein CgunFtcFv8_000804 [Champsocephalus gunnari]
MMQLRTLFFTSILLPWILSTAAKDKYMEVRRHKKDTANLSDYDTVQDSVTDPAAAPKAVDMPTCLLCVCLFGSVYCEEVFPEMSAVPALPKETAHLYARFNKITKIRNQDFADIATIKTIDLTGNLITEIDDGTFSKLLLLEELILVENKLTKLPMLPAKLTLFNANFNQLKTKGVKATAFKVVHLHNNKISTVTDETFCRGNSSYYIRTNMDEVRLDGNPVVLSEHPDSFICLQALPIGWYH